MEKKGAENRILEKYLKDGIFKDLREDYVVVDAFDPRVAPAVAAAVAKAAMDTGVARIQVDPEQIRRNTAARTQKK